MNSSSSFIGRAAAAAVAVVLLGACESSSVSWRNAQAASQLAGMKTFRVTGPTAGGTGFSVDAFNDSVTLAIIAALKERGYTPVSGDTSDLAVEWSYQLATTGNPGYFATPAQQPGGPPLTIQTVALNIYVSPGAGGKTLWRATSPFPVARNEWSSGTSANLARETLRNFPPYRETPNGVPVAPSGEPELAPAQSAPATAPAAPQ